MTLQDDSFIRIVSGFYEPCKRYELYMLDALCPEISVTIDRTSENLKVTFCAFMSENIVCFGYDKGLVEFFDLFEKQNKKELYAPLKVQLGSVSGQSRQAIVSVSTIHEQSKVYAVITAENMFHLIQESEAQVSRKPSVRQ